MVKGSQALRMEGYSYILKDVAIGREAYKKRR